jgi:hypothetical protein
LLNKLGFYELVSKPKGFKICSTFWIQGLNQ